jgi:hypothetical protein
MGVIFVLISLAGPALIHVAYRVTTSLSEKQAQTERYRRLENAEAFDVSLSEAQRMRIREERLRLLYWFHARGWNIDEDDEDRSWLQPWRELIHHWTTQQGASKALAPTAGAASSALFSATLTRHPARRSPQLGRSANNQAHQ